jgi:DNA-binding XRE family transcriptional regulator
MKKSVIFEVSNYRLKIARLFIPANKIANALGVTVQTMYRWEKNVSPMSDQDVRRLEDVIRNSAHDVFANDWGRQTGTFGEDFKKCVISALDDAPALVYVDRDKRKHVNRTHNLREALNTLLKGKTRSSTGVIETLVEEGFSVAAIQRVSKDMGVKKTVKGFGRAQKSFWSLK